MEPNRPIDRLLIYLDTKRISPFKAENELGISNGYIKNALKRDGSIGSQILEKIVNAYLDISLSWLVTGGGEMLITGKTYADTPAVDIHLNDEKGEYTTITPAVTGRGKDKKIQKSVHPTVHPTAFLSPKIVTVDKSGKENIVYVPVKAAAGYLLGFGDPAYIETLPSFSLPGLTNSTYRAFEVDGDSMFPTLENKEMVIGQWVEKLEFIREDRVHIIVTKNRGVIVKRLLNRIEKYGYIIAKSDAIDNRNLFPNIEIAPDEVVEIWYAVWHGSFNFKSPTELYKKVNNLEADLTEVLRVLKANKLLPK
ncbi:S24 family peptidase [Mucilaginibacter sp.]|uniref:S24 family peptidase n=1 Tax=Mucilaginibacter sp. TaxID=1882438 RepID=UPI0025CF72D4|nr:S24 family peptidase [Mucilaginibacter sp.]